MNRNDKAAVGIGILALLAVGLILGVSTTAEGAKAPAVYEKPLETSTSTVWGTLPTTTTSTTAAPQIATPVAIEHKAVPKPVVRKATTTTTVDTTPETEAMDEDVHPSPLQVAQTYVGKPNQWGPNWCAKFVSAMAQEAGVPNWTSRPGPSALWADAMNGNRVHPLPQVGDMGFADLRDPSTRAEYDVQPMHVFIVESVNGDEYSTIEGNFDETQLVVRNTRHVSDGYTIAFASFPS